MGHPPTSRAQAEALDRDDPLSGLRERFVLADGLIYLDGHSLGPATRSALDRLHETATRGWATRLIRSWNDAGDGKGWIDLPSRTGARIAKLIGVESGDVIVTDSVSVNLFKLAAAALPTVVSPTLIVESDEFPTDQYMAEGLCDLVQAKFVRTPAGEGATALARTGGVLVKSVVNYRTAAVADIAAHEAIARNAGGIIVWDLSHGAGVLDLALSADGARLAAGCTYKYLNGGPGAPAYVFARSDVAVTLRNPLSGWMGHAAPFSFDVGYAPADGVSRFAAGTPSILSLATLDGALDAFDGITLTSLTAKARALGDLCAMRASALGLEVLSPLVGEVRGGHVSLRHENGYAIVQALIAANIVADFRAPDVMRFGCAPLYVRFVDAWDAMDSLDRILATRAWDCDAYRRVATVT